MAVVPINVLPEAVPEVNDTKIELSVSLGPSVPVVFETEVKGLYRSSAYDTLR